MKLRAVILAFLLISAPCLAASTDVQIEAVADTFVRSLDPDHNYGAAGGLAVSGAGAVNAGGEQMGLLDTFIRFDSASAVTDLDSALGSSWRITSVVLRVVEQGEPNNTIFNRGVGQFEVRWIARDDWEEGTGNPRLPSTDGVTWNDVPSLLGAADETLGVFWNAGADGELTFSLSLAAPFVQDLAAGGPVSLYLTAADDAIGFTFDSRRNTPPMLTVTAQQVLSPWPIPGDVNRDCRVNIIDLIAVRNLLCQDPASGDNWAADVNEDGSINIVDMIFVRNHLNTSCEEAR